MTPFDELNGSRDPLVAALGEESHLDEAYLRRVLDAIPSPVSYVDAGLRYRYNNRAYDACVGRPREGLCGMHLREVLGEKAYAVILPYVEEVLSGREAYFEKELEYADGSLRYVHASHIPELDASGA